MNDNLNDEWSSSVTDLEIDMLLLYYTFSDQYGRVDVLQAANYAAKKLGFILNKEPFTIDQRHVDILMDKGMIPDVRVIFNKILMMPPEQDE